MKQAGFTLLEMLISLLIISTLILLLVPIMQEALVEREIQQFFQQFEADVFYVQYDAFHLTERSKITFKKTHYVLEDKTNKIERSYPAKLNFIATTNKSIAYSAHGTVVYPITYLMQTDKANYEIIFPLGKGGYYVQKNGGIYTY